jgi:hypothetical protein
MSRLGRFLSDRWFLMPWQYADCDVLYSHGPLPIFIFGKAIPYVIDVGFVPDDYFRDIPGPVDRSPEIQELKVTLSRAHFAVINCEDSRRRLSELLPEFSSKLVVSTTYLLSELVPIPESQLACKMNGRGLRRVSFIGRHRRRKGLQEFVDSL